MCYEAHIFNVIQHSKYCPTTKIQHVDMHVLIETFAGTMLFIYIPIRPQRNINGVTEAKRHTKNMEYDHL